MDQGILDIIVFIDISRRNVERALKAGNYYSAAFLAGEMRREAGALEKVCNKVAKKRNAA